MGKNGIVIWKRANGIDTTPVVPYSEEKSMSKEKTYESDTMDMELLNRTIHRMVEKLAFKLRKNQKLASVVTVKIRYANYDTHTLQRKVPYTSSDHILLQTAKELFGKLYTRRMLVRLIGVKFSGLVGGVQQLSLFDNSEKQVKLYLSMDRIRLRYGSGSIMRATCMDYKPDNVLCT